MQIRILERSKGSYVVFVPQEYCNCAANIDMLAREVSAPKGSEWIILNESDVDVTEPRELDLLEE